jgi:DNA-binding CsgD family transcriptional regulator
MDAMRNQNSVEALYTAAGQAAQLEPSLESLTPRESQVLREICAGAANKEIGRMLAISPRTVEVHRARIMAKIGARNAADLVRIVLSGRGYAAARPDFGA